MDKTWAIGKKEFRSYFSSPIAYIFITSFLAFSGWLFLRTFFLENTASMRNFFGLLPWLLLIFVPAVTMRLWAEERKLGTLELLLTLPVKDYQLVIGKFLASFAFLSLTLVLSFSLALIVAGMGDPDPGPIIGGYLGALLLGGAYLSVGLFVSSLTENQIVAFIIGVLLCFALLVIGEQFVLFAVPRVLVPLFQYLGL
jgi:ABC-2 type transport system permease protein